MANAVSESNRGVTFNLDAMVGKMNELIDEQRATRAQLAKTQKDMRAYIVYNDYQDSTVMLEKAKRVAGIKQAV